MDWRWIGPPTAALQPSTSLASQRTRQPKNVARPYPMGSSQKQGSPPAPSTRREQGEKDGCNHGVWPPESQRPRQQRPLSLARTTCPSAPTRPCSSQPAHRFGGPAGLTKTARRAEPWCPLTPSGERGALLTNDPVDGCLLGVPSPQQLVGKLAQVLQIGCGVEKATEALHRGLRAGDHSISRTMTVVAGMATRYRRPGQAPCQPLPAEHGKYCVL
jgi:hypothetical protein